MEKTRKKQIKQYIAWGCLAVVVVLLAVMPMLASSGAAEDGPQVSILTAQAERKDISKKLIGGGILTSDDNQELTIPVEVKLVEYLVGNGDVVSKGDAIAVVDRVSVMTAITQVQETLDYLAAQIESVSGDEVSESVTSQVGGTVKRIYAEAGDDVQDVMLEHGALAVISLDGLMAVKLERRTELTAGDAVCVTLADDTEVEGTVASNLDGVLVVTVEDDDYAAGDTVTVSTEDGDHLGTGELYIYSPWTAHGYSGTVFSVPVKEGQTVSSGQTLLRLKETGATSDYQKLVNQRREYEEMMQELFQMYSTQTLTAPCDGIVSGVDTDGAFLLSDSGEGWTVSLLGHTQTTSFLGYTARVLDVREDGLELLADPIAQTSSDLGNIRVDTAAMTESWSYTGDTRVYVQNENGLLEADGNANVGDILFFAGDEAAIHWIIRMEEAPSVKHTVADTGFRAVLLEAEGDESGDGAGGEGEEPEEPAAPYSGYSAMVISVTENTMMVLQNPTPAPMADASLGMAPTSPIGLTVTAEYTSELAADLQPGDLILVVLDSDGTVQNIIKGGNAYSAGQTPGGQIPGGDMSGIMGDLSGMMGDMSGLMGGMSGFGGSAMVEVFTPYSLETLTIATVTSQETMTLDVVVDEEDVRLLSVGQKAELMVGAMGGERFDAVITKISNNGENAGGRSKFTVTASTTKHEDMYPGMSGVLVIPTGSVENVLTIPVAALVEDGAKTIVYTGYDEKKETLINPVEVTTGISDGEMVEVIGLDEGDTVYYSYYDTLEQSLTPERRRLF